MSGCELNDMNISKCNASMQQFFDTVSVVNKHWWFHIDLTPCRGCNWSPLPRVIGCCCHGYRVQLRTKRKEKKKHWQEAFTLHGNQSPDNTSPVCLCFWYMKQFLTINERSRSNLWYVLYVLNCNNMKCFSEEKNLIRTRAIMCEWWCKRMNVRNGEEKKGYACKMCVNAPSDPHGRFVSLLCLFSLPHLLLFSAACLETQNYLSFTCYFHQET